MSTDSTASSQVRYISEDETMSPQVLTLHRSFRWELGERKTRTKEKQENGVSEFIQNCIILSYISLYILF